MATKSEAKKQSATFVWQGVNKRGQKSKGEMVASSPTAVKAELRRQGIDPKRISKKSKPLFGNSRKVTPKEIAVLMRQLATMMSSGVPLVQSFEIIAKGHDNPTMRDLVVTIKGDLEGGTTLTDSMRKHPIYFDKLTCNLIHAGEQAGILESLLDKLATYKEKSEAIKSKVKKALFYPAAVVIAAFVISAILLIFVIPQFQELFSNFGADLPALTLVVIQLSEAFQKYWWAIFGGIILGSYYFSYMHRKSEKLQHAIQRLSLKIPVIGAILDKAAIARYARTTSTMFAAGVPLVEALDSVAGAVGNVVYGKAIETMREEVSSGTSLTDSMNNTGVFPNMVNQMVAIGEEAGSLDSMLSKVADFYEAEVDDLVDALSSLLEPMIMAVLGGVVGTLVVAMYLPIFKMGEVV